MTTIPYTIFDKALHKKLEQIFIELLKIYKKNDSYTFHFIGVQEMVNLSDDDLGDIPDDPEDYNERVLYIQSRIEKALREHKDYSLLEGLYTLGGKKRYEGRNLKGLSELIEIYNNECKTIIKEFLNEENSRLSPIHRHYKIGDFGLNELFEISSSVDENKESIHRIYRGLMSFDWKLILKKIEEQEKLGDNLYSNLDDSEIPAKSRIDNYYGDLFHSVGLGMKSEFLFEKLKQMEYLQFHKFNLPNKKSINQILETEYEQLLTENFEIGLNYAKNQPYYLSRSEVKESIWYNQHYPNHHLDSTLYYEFFNQEIIISSHAYISHCIEYKGENIDWDYAPSYWIPRDILATCLDNYYLPTSVLLFIVRKIYYFEKNLSSHISNIKNEFGMKNKKQAIKFLSGFFQDNMNDKKLKIKVLEGIKFPKLITNLYIECLIIILKKALIIEKGRIFKPKYIKASNPFMTFKDEDFKLSSYLEEQIESLETEVKKGNDFYYPYKLYWDSNKNGTIKRIFYELNNSAYNTKGKPYMEKGHIDLLIHRIFTEENIEVSIERKQISLPYNRYIGSIRVFLYSFKETYYKNLPEEYFAQILRDNFFSHFKKQKFNLTFESLQKIASNMHKGAKPEIKLPPRQ